MQYVSEPTKFDFSSKTSWLYNLQGDPKFSPPPSAKIESFYEILTNAFLNTIYLKIIWRVSISGIEYLRHTESFSKIDCVSFLLCFGHLDGKNFVTETVFSFDFWATCYMVWLETWSVVPS